jgi:hypothetical protein
MRQITLTVLVDKDTTRDAIEYLHDALGRYPRVVDLHIEDFGPTMKPQDETTSAINRTISHLQHYNAIRQQLYRIAALVQENQDWFNAPLGGCAYEAAANKLQDLIEEDRRRKAPRMRTLPPLLKDF